MAEHRPKPTSPRRIGAREFRANLTSFLDQILEGHRFVLISHDKIVAEIGPPSPRVAVRKPGVLRGKIKVREDFDAYQSGMQPEEDKT